MNREAVILLLTARKSALFLVKTPVPATLSIKTAYFVDKNIKMICLSTKKGHFMDRSENSYGQVIFTQNGESYEFFSTEGYFVFTEYQIIGGAEVLSGHFEFTAVDLDKNLTINVTDGTFENLVG